MSKHTPGPLVGLRGRHKHREAIFLKNQELNVFVAKIYGHEGQPVEANAALLGTAPELLEACRVALALETDDWKDFPLSNPEKWESKPDSNQALVEMLKAAITKAEGSEP